MLRGFLWEEQRLMIIRRAVLELTLSDVSVILR